MIGRSRRKSRRASYSYSRYSRRGRAKNILATVGAIVVVLFFVVLGAEALFFSDEQLFEATVVNKYHERGYYDYDDDYHPPKWVIEIRHNKNHVYQEILVSEGQYHHYSQQNNVMCATIQGRYTGIPYTTSILQIVPKVKINKPVRPSEAELTEFSPL